MADNEKRVSTGGVSEVPDDRNPQQQYQEQYQEQVIVDSSSEYNEVMNPDLDFPNLTPTASALLIPLATTDQLN